MLLLKDFNAHGSLWNSQTARANVSPLKTLIEQHNLQIENDSDISTRSKSTSEISIIDLVLTSQKLELLQLWAVDAEHQISSDHELIVLEWKEIMRNTADSSKEITEWHLQNLQKNAQVYKHAVQS